MSLTKDDLDKIRNVVKSEINLVNIRLDKLEARMFNLEMLMKENKKEHQEILAKIEELKNAYTEDIDDVCVDLEKLEKRVTKLEAKAV